MIALTKTEEQLNNDRAEGTSDLCNSEVAELTHTLEGKTITGTKDFGEANAETAEPETANAAAECGPAVAARSWQWILRLALADRCTDRLKQGGAFLSP